MAKCAICGKHKTFGNQVSHSNIKTRRTWSPNLRRVRALVDGHAQRIMVCTRCLRSGRVTRAV